jgi:hypothetical protein
MENRKRAGKGNPKEVPIPEEDQEKQGLIFIELLCNK